MPTSVVLFAVEDIPLIQPGDDLGRIICERSAAQGQPLQDGDVVVVAQKVVSKAEGRILRLSTVPVTPEAERIAAQTGKAPHLVAAILSESNGVERVARSLVIVEQRLGFVCANAGIDHSNVAEDHDLVTLLPVDPDASAARLRARIGECAGVEVAVIINDSQGRAFRNGIVGVAIGQSGIAALDDRRGERDIFGYELQVTVIAQSDQIASAASILMGQSHERRPVVVLRGLDYLRGEGSARELVRRRELDLFR